MYCRLSLAISSVLAFSVSPPTLAQLVPDATLPTPTTIEIDGRTQRITGGTQAGGNLFHSFDRFDVPDNSTAYFDNALTIEHIITRVTGRHPSQIHGTIRANGTANLYLLNPNGISIGANARLDLGGSFFGTTGDRLSFADGTEFLAQPETASPLLTVSVPTGVQLGPNSGNIAIAGTGHNLFFDENLATARDNRPDGFAVAPGNSLVFVSPTLTLNGANLTAPNGRIVLSAVTAGRWTFDATTLDPNTVYGDVRLSDSTSVDVSGNGGGELLVLGRRLFLESGSTLLSDTLGDAPGRGIVLRTTELIDIRGLSSDRLFSSGFFAAVSPQASGDGGDILVETDRLVVVDSSILGADTFGSGNAGTLTVRASEVETRNSFWSGTSFETATGRGGRTIFEVDRLLVADGAQILAITWGDGNAGSIDVRSRELVEVRGLGRSITEDLPGRVFKSLLSTAAGLEATGRGGEITIETARLRLVDGGVISTLTRSDAPTSPAGTLTVRTTEAIEIIGRDSENLPSGLLTNTTGDAPGADLIVETPRLTVRDGGQLSAGTFGGGNGGDVWVRVSEEIDLSGTTPLVELGRGDFARDASGTQFPSGIFSASEGAGSAGNLDIETSVLRVGDRAEVAVDSIETGSAGSLSIRADRVVLDDGGRFRADSRGGLGNINLEVRDLQLRGGSRISTNALEEATGGNIFIEAETLVALENSDITATAQQGFGGRVSIAARGIFGPNLRDRLTPESDITASSDSGAAFSGIVEIETPDIKPRQGLETLPIAPIDVAGLVVDRCMALNAGSEFVVTGRGGLPPDPWQALSSQPLWSDFQIVDPSPTRDVRENTTDRFEGRSPDEPLVEARGWRKNPDGSVTLVAVIPATGSSQSWPVERLCR
ncbi:Putative hemagglutinin-related protein [Geitlerinema sp. FC II]|nr:Putative hemagglutinin-related protein [Geitlerinema sp. FC II]